jgi:hemoglobin
MFTDVGCQMGDSAAVRPALARPLLKESCLPRARPHEDDHADAGSDRRHRYPSDLVTGVEMKIGCVSEDGIALLVDCFYAKLRVDPILGPIFERVIRGRWEPHLETMRNFWSSVMLTSGRYKGAPVPAHLRIKGVEPQMFDLWLRLFYETCDELFENEVAEAFRAKAVRIAESLTLALFFRVDRTSAGQSS